MSGCDWCPRACGVQRDEGESGFCGVGNRLRIARAALHEWEEPPISGKNGAGAVFFSGCNLRCVFCQNDEVSHAGLGREISEDELAEILFSLRDQGAATIDLVTPTPFAGLLLRVLERVKPELGIPVVWNCGGYESVKTVEMLSGVVDVWLPDFKYASPELSLRFSSARDYADRAAEALAAMYRAAGRPAFRSDGVIARGVIVRHLVLPGHRDDSTAVLRRIAETVPADGVLLSLMSQYTPDFAVRCEAPELHRRVTSFEYDSVLRCAESLGFDGFFQRRASAESKYTPEFSGEPFPKGVH